jgi:hypothetical protein
MDQKVSDVAETARVHVNQRFTRLRVVNLEFHVLKPTELLNECIDLWLPGDIFNESPATELLKN